MQDFARRPGRFMLGVTAFVVAAALAGCGDPDPNVACAKHGGVLRVYQTGNNVNGVVCRDGYYVAGSRWN